MGPFLPFVSVQRAWHARACERRTAHLAQLCLDIADGRDTCHPHPLRRLQGADDAFVTRAALTAPSRRLHNRETLPSGARPRLAARWLHSDSCWGARSSVSAWNCWHAGRDSNPRPPGSKPDRSARNDAYLRVLPCGGMQAAAQSGTQDGPTALGGPSFQAPPDEVAAAFLYWMNSAKERTSSRDFATGESVWSGGGLQASGPGSAPIFRGPDLPRGGRTGADVAP